MVSSLDRNNAMNLKEFIFAILHHHHGHTAVGGVEFVAGMISKLGHYGTVAFSAGLVGVGAQVVSTWLALGSGLLEARELVANERLASGFSRGFVAGLLNWSGKNVLDYLGIGKSFNAFDQNIANAGDRAYYQGLANGYQMSTGLSAERKKMYLGELRVHAGSAGDQSTIKQRADRVIELAAKLRRHFMESK
jgi:hypothetical protein